MRPLIPILALLSVLLFQAAAHQCVLRDTPNQPSTTLPDSRINDDYCDCLDGSDENLTSACPNGTFICTNTAYRKKTIPASWVRDGSCDCCDGSDEAPGRCPDNCAALREKEMKEAKKHADTVMRGVATRQTYVKQASGAFENDARELRKLQRELAAIDRALNRSKATADGLRKRRDWQPPSPVVERSNPVSSSNQEPPSSAERLDDVVDDEYHYEEHIKEDEEHIKEDEEPEEPIEKESDSDGQKDADDPHDIDEEDEEDEDDFDDEDDDEDDDEEEEKEKDEDEEYNDDVDYPKDEKDNEDLDGDLDDDEDEAITSARTTEKESETKQEDDAGPGSDEYTQTSMSASETESDSKVTPEPSLNVDSICAELESSGFNHIFRLAAYARAVVLAKLHRVLPKVFPVRPGSAISGLDECIRQADSAKYKFQSQRSNVEEKIKKLKEKQTTDYGVDKALRKLHGECTKTKVMQYEFEHCAFDLVRQYEHGSAIATLGRFDGWEVDGNERYMKYTNGDTCWNGPSRSIKVQLLCGEKEEIVSVDEPNRCTYFMKFRTPAVCEKGMADEIMSGFDTGNEQKEEL